MPGDDEPVIGQEGHGGEALRVVGELIDLEDRTRIDDRVVAPCLDRRQRVVGPRRAAALPGDQDGAILGEGDGRIVVRGDGRMVVDLDLAAAAGKPHLDARRDGVGTARGEALPDDRELSDGVPGDRRVELAVGEAVDQSLHSLGRAGAVEYLSDDVPVEVRPGVVVTLPDHREAEIAGPGDVGIALVADIEGIDQEVVAGWRAVGGVEAGADVEIDRPAAAFVALPDDHEAAVRSHGDGGNDLLAERLGVDLELGRERSAVGAVPPCLNTARGAVTARRCGALPDDDIVAHGIGGNIRHRLGARRHAVDLKLTADRTGQAARSPVPAVRPDERERQQNRQLQTRLHRSLAGPLRQCPAPASNPLACRSLPAPVAARRVGGSAYVTLASAARRRVTQPRNRRKGVFHRPR